ncbi:MAG: ATP-binding cassette domain-containing protein [Ectothiorhodospiraceae bacterium]|nr:ATP-binding cassette domain-containing protein [Ectothiorhodospiraceae bacterium]MCH8504039.1 ATP-binding cassette domain-containing protein [Ectothiorhodospiraceae bacterium]
MDPAINVQGLTKHFRETTALDDVSFWANPGTVLGLLGPNGAGKTTAVRVLATLLKADAGHASVGGYDVRTQAHLVRQRIGLTGQYASVDEKLTGRENLLLIGRLLGLSRRDARRRAQELLSEFSLEEAAGRAAKTYSGGMRRRLDLAASLIGRPSILFLDEPTTGLDPRARLDLWNLIRRLVADGTTVLLTTQYLEEADQLADDIVVLDRGRIIASGTPEQLKQHIGARTLAVQARQEQDVPAIAAMLADLTGGHAEVAGLTISVPAPDPGHLPALVRRLDASGISVNELMLRSASLDDVFLTLTGRHAEPTGAPTEQRESSA